MPLSGTIETTLKPVNRAMGHESGFSGECRPVSPNVTKIPPARTYRSIPSIVSLSITAVSLSTIHAIVADPVVDEAFLGDRVAFIHGVRGGNVFHR